MDEKKKKKIDRNILVLTAISIIFLVLLCIADELWNISESLVTGILMLWAVYTVTLIIVSCVVEKIYNKRKDKKD